MVARERFGLLPNLARIERYMASPIPRIVFPGLGAKKPEPSEKAMTQKAKAKKKAKKKDKTATSGKKKVKRK